MFENTSTNVRSAIRDVKLKTKGRYRDEREYIKVISYLVYLHQTNARITQISTPARQDRCLTVYTYVLFRSTYRPATSQ